MPPRRTPGWHVLAGTGGTLGRDAVRPEFAAFSLSAAHSASELVNFPKFLFYENPKSCNTRYTSKKRGLYSFD